MKKWIMICAVTLIFTSNSFAQIESPHFNAWVYMMHECNVYSLAQAYRRWQEEWEATRSEKAWRKMKQLEAVYIECIAEGRIKDEE